MRGHYGRRTELTLQESGPLNAGRAVAKRAGIHVTSHMLRHGAVTRLMHAGVPPTTIVKIMGWTSVRMLDTYAHSLPAAEAAAMDVLGDDD